MTSTKYNEVINHVSSPPSVLAIQDTDGGAESAFLPQGGEGCVPAGGAEDMQDTEVCPSTSSGGLSLRSGSLI